MYPLDASAITTGRVPLNNAQEPPGDAPEDADNLSAKDAGHATTNPANNTITIKLYETLSCMNL
jgi:hypothetical protein